MNNYERPSAERLIAALDDLLGAAECLGELRAEAAADQLTNEQVGEAFLAIPEQEAALQSLRAGFERALRELARP